MKDEWITEGQWATLDAARQLRPKPVGVIPVVGAIVLGIGTVGAAIWTLLNNLPLVYPLALGAGFVAAACWPNGRARAWRTRFNGEHASQARMIVPLPGVTGGPTLTYEILRPQFAWERLRIDLPEVSQISIGPDEAPIGDPAFDRALGLGGPQMTRALLGGALREAIPRWHTHSRLLLAEGTVVLHIGEMGYDVPSPEVDAICAMFQAFAERMAAPPMAGLTTLATDTAHPFDAARALAMLADGWSAQAKAVAALLSGDPVGAALARVATTGEGLLDEALDWPTRSAIGRGVLGARGPAQTALVKWMFGQQAAGEAHAMLLVELCDAAYALLKNPVFKAQAVDAEQLLVTRGGPAVLAWMRRRAHLEQTARSLKILSARLQSEQGGLLSLEDGAFTGGLSEAQGGELSPASLGPGSACLPDQPATDS